MGAQRKITLALDGKGVSLTGLLVELHVPRLPVLGEALGLGLQCEGLLDMAGPLREKCLPLLIEKALVER
ncbi:MAG: hypothetical protein EDR02_08975 [Actinobacteria bacterium]|nr:MAG: hypothetical protein EDR02_08975 [Actinomycetota bacterium]RIK06522.1 MAG: hypothetical protein DCC48_06300 [Acidobacteriota bacterium]